MFYFVGGTVLCETIDAATVHRRHWCHWKDILSVWRSICLCLKLGLDQPPHAVTFCSSLSRCVELKSAKQKSLSQELKQAIKMLNHNLFAKYAQDIDTRLRKAEKAHL